jgi:hypothetical protein
MIMNRIVGKGSPYLSPIKGKNKFDREPLIKMAREGVETS